MIDIRILGRERWGAKPPSGSYLRIDMPTPVVYVHHSASDAFGPSALRSFQNYHMTKKDMRDIAYSFLIDNDGTIWTGRGAGVAHGGNTGDDNRFSHSICLMGNLQNHPPSSEATLSLVTLLAFGSVTDWWELDDVRGHRQEPGASTACPGNYLMLQLPHLVNMAKAKVRDNDDPQPKEWSDMATKAEVEQAVFDGVVKAFNDKPNHAVGKVVARLTRELESPTSDFRQALVKAVKEAG